MTTDITSVPRLGFRTQTDFVVLCAEAVDVARKFEVFRLSAVAAKSVSLCDGRIASGFSTNTTPELQSIEGKRLQFCLGIDVKTERVELLGDHFSNMTILSESSVLIYFLGVPQLLIWHDDDIPLNLKLTSSRDIIASKAREFVEMVFV